jgi:hypothetical protein
MKPIQTPTQLRLTQDLLERADALIEVMAADPEVRALGMPTRTAVLRLAIARGLRDLEHQYQQPTTAVGDEAQNGPPGLRSDAARSHTAA